MPLVGKSEFARLRGVTPAAVTAAIRTGRIREAVVVRGKRELLDQDRAMELWERNTLVQAPQAERAAPAAVVTPTPAQVRAYIEALPEDAIPDLNESRARREHYQAEQAKLAALQGRGELVPVAEVKAQAFALARSVRDGLMGIPDRLAPMLAATQDARQVHHLLSEEIRVALRVLADG